MEATQDGQVTSSDDGPLVIRVVKKKKSKGRSKAKRLKKTVFIVKYNSGPIPKPKVNISVQPEASSSSPEELPGTGPPANANQSGAAGMQSGQSGQISPDPDPGHAIEYRMVRELATRGGRRQWPPPRKLAGNYTASYLQAMTNPVEKSPEDIAKERAREEPRCLLATKEVMEQMKDILEQDRRNAEPMQANMNGQQSTADGSPDPSSSED